MAWLDHLVMSCETLTDGEAALSKTLGLPLAGGGEHQAMSTHNRLLSLGDKDYFELIAVNPNAPDPGRKRWFALDRFAGAPRLTNWVIACDNLEAALALAPKGMGQPMSLSRGDLRWRMAVPESGELPFDNLFPALIEWEGDAHPAARLPDQGARLNKLRLSHPQASALSAALLPLMKDPRIEIAEGPSAMNAEIMTTRGTVFL